jgi:catechol 2,3-dioxygenase-like lactoylglutathione lyase family enzyme
MPAHSRLGRAVPYFLVDDVLATAAFYRDVLGFGAGELIGEPPGFVIVDRDDARLVFRQMRPARPPVARPNCSIMDEAFDVYVYVSDVDQFAAELRGKNAEMIEGPVDRIYRMRELLVRDCNGCVLAFGEG